MASLPSDPREEGAIEWVDKQDIQSLQHNHMLRMKLLDYILCYICTLSTTIDGVNFAMGSTLSRSMFFNWLQPQQPTWKIKSLKESLANFRFVKHSIIIPDIISAHFHVIDVAINYISSNFISSVEFYDSTNTSVDMKNEKVRSFMESLVNVLNEFFLKPRKKCCELVPVLKLITSQPCPQHSNGVGCGLLLLLYQYTSLQVLLCSSENYFTLYSSWTRKTFSVEMHCSCFQHLNDQDEKKPAANLDCDESLLDVCPRMDVCIFSQGTLSADSSSLESDLEEVPESHAHHAVSPIQQSAQSTFKRMTQQNMQTTQLSNQT